MVVTAGFDPLVDQGEAYAKRLHDARTPVVYRCYDGLAHAFTAFTGVVPAADVACREIAGLVREALKAASIDSRTCGPWWSDSWRPTTAGRGGARGRTAGSPGPVRGAGAGARRGDFPDLLMTRGEYQLKPTLPFTPGMEMSGEVAALGAG